MVKVGRFLHQFVAACVRSSAAFALGIVLCLGSANVQASPSYCTAIWGSIDQGGVKSLRTYNTSQNLWNTPSVATLTGNANALSGASTNGLLYYADRNTQTLYSVDPSQSPVITASVGVIATPSNALASGTPSGFQLIGATADPSGNLYMMVAASVNGASATPAMVLVAGISTSNAATLTSWTQLRSTSGNTPSFASSGDIYFDSANQAFILTNTTQPTFAQIDLNPGATFGNVTTPSTIITGPVTGLAWGGASVNPVNGQVYLGAGNTGSATFTLNGSVGAKVDSGAYLVVDMGNCTLPTPDLPTVTKTFNPTSAGAAFGTTTLTINLGNTNKAAIWLNSTFTDVLPTNMRVTDTSALTTSGCGAISGNNVTSTVGSTSITFGISGKIPAGGCSITVVVQATTTGSFNNTIVAGSYSTTVGSNAAAASALYLVNTRDFSVTKTQVAGSTGTFTNGPVSMPAGGTVWYQLTVTNSGSSVSSGTVTFTDTLPSLITPVLSVVVNTVTSGNCSFATATFATGNATRITGTFATVGPGGQCIVTIVARGSSTVASSSVANNTVSIAGTTPFPDASSGNNTDTVATTINPGVSLSITKTNGITALTAGQTTSYTITVVATAPPTTVTNALVTDPAQSGLNCTSVTLKASGSAVTPTLSATSIPSLQTGGIPITFNPGSAGTATFVVTCGVTATGQ